MGFRDKFEVSGDYRAARSRERGAQQATGSSSPPPDVPPSSSDRPWYRKKRWIAAMAFGVLVFAVALSGGAEDTTETAATGEASESEAQPEAAAVESSAPAVAVEEANVEEASLLEQLAAETDLGSIDDCDELAAMQRLAAEVAADDGSDAETLDGFQGEIDDRMDAVCEPEPSPTPTKKPKPKPPAFSKSDYVDLDHREFAKIVRDPDAHVGEKVLVFGEVFQFDAATGQDAFLANVDGDQQHGDFVFYEDNALLVGKSAAQLEDVVEGDLFAAWATVTGSLSYDTQIGGNTTVPTFVVDKIKVTGSAS